MKNTPAPLPPRTPPTIWRLVTLALGLSALIAFVGRTAGWSPWQWLIASSLSKTSLAAASPGPLLLARIGIDVWLPASGLMLLFLLADVPRRPVARQPAWTAVVPILAFGVHCMVVEAWPMIVRGPRTEVRGFMLGLFGTASCMVLLAATIAVAIMQFQTMRGTAGPWRRGASLALLAFAVLPPMLLLAPLLADPSHPLAAASAETTRFQQLCADVGTRFVNKPAGPVQSVVYDHDPADPTTQFESEVATDGHGRVLRYPGFPARDSALARKRLSLAFTECRRDLCRTGAATINPSAPYYHLPAQDRNEPYYGVDAPTADVLVLLEARAEAPQPTDEAPTIHGPIRYTVTLTDRRSGATLGVQTYVVDASNQRACGVNVDAAISRDAFIHDAIQP